MPFAWLSDQFELSRGHGGNVRPMEGMRGLAVFLVFLVHYSTLVNPWIPEASLTHLLGQAAHAVGNAGVDLFFVLSGYLIYGTLIRRDQPFGPYMGRRVRRIYPTFTVVFLLYVFLSWVFPAESKIPGTSSEALLYLAQNYLLLPGLVPIEPMITVAWSLSYEMFFYLLVPALVTGLRLRDRPVAWRTLFCIACALLTVVLCGAWGGPIRLIMFVSGMLLFEALAMRSIPVPNSAVGAAALIAGLAGMLLPVQGSWGVALQISILFVAFFIFCLAAFARPTAPLGRVLSWTPLRWLGNMSYSYYLLHGLALKAGFLVLSKTMPPDANASALIFWWLLVPMFALTVVASAPLFLVVERPLSLVQAPRASGVQVSLQ